MRRIFFAVLLLAPFAACQARDPAPEMRSRVEAALREQGYTAWDDIEVRRDGRIAVDDARGADGKEYDLKLDSQTLRVVERKEDD